jgi:phosphoenolpyruvate carboxykinase (GTP)
MAPDLRDPVGAGAARSAPLVYEARSWSHGVLVGAGMASETTAAAVGQMGVVRRDSMAMKPFCGYNFGDYWKHWLSFEGRSGKLPRIFHVNWFRQDKNGRFMWPGYGENLRVLRWITDRCDGRVEAQDTPIGFPQAGPEVTGLNLDAATMDTLLSVDPVAWRHEVESIGKYLTSSRERVPAKLREEPKEVAKQN